MPIVSRRPAAQRERDRLQARRLRAAELFTAGVRQAEIARQLGVCVQAVSVWYAVGRRVAPRGCAAVALTGCAAPAMSRRAQRLAGLTAAILA
jgi:hypothetical protein